VGFSDGQTHLTSMQLAPVGQTRPQTPQFWGLLRLPVQTPLQHASRLPLVGSQTFPHWPQWLKVRCKSTQPPPGQKVRPGVLQTQTPLLQVAPAGQTWPQAPQWLGLVCRLTQAPLHAVWPVGHARGRTHCPFTQLALGGHCLPQAPQWLLSVCVLTQAPEQLRCPVGQTQMPLLQIRPGEQRMPQPPQFCGSFFSSTHVPLQQRSPSQQSKLVGPGQELPCVQ
jgi:hypothetical protein